MNFNNSFENSFNEETIKKEEEIKDIKSYLKEYLEQENDLEKLKIIKAEGLLGNYKEQYEALNDERLADVKIAIVPDKVWVKGSQPSESHAEKQLILMKESYYEQEENPDEIAWMNHELAHCKKMLDSESEEQYLKDMQTYAFNDIKTEYAYPNNLVEEYTFTEQFKYLKDKGKSKEEILEEIKKEYKEEEDVPFFKKILNKVYN